MLSTLEALLPEADLLITSGGVSMGGEHDVVKAALSKLGTVTFRKVAMQPGMPQGFGVLGPDRTPIFTLPGNPVSAFVSFCLFAAARAAQACKIFLRNAAPAHGGPDRPGALARGQKVVSARCARRRPRQTVVPLTGQSSHQLGALAQANALIIVPEPFTRLEAGDGADVICLP